MFKFLHAADIHLDSPLRGLSSYETAPAEAIRGASRRALENLVELAQREQVAFVLLAGDLYDGDQRDYRTGIFISHLMGRLGKHDIAVYVVTGNHDAASKITRVFPPANMTVLSHDAPETVIRRDLGVAIHGQGFATPREDGNLAAGFPDATAGLFNIGLLHTSLDGREGHADYAPCKLDDLRARGYQYWALGHVHAREVVSQDPWVVFPGCIQGRHIRETGAKGCTVVTVEDDVVRDVRAHSLDVFRWARCTVDVEDAVDPQAVLERLREPLGEALQSAGDRPVAVRVRLEGATRAAGRLASDPEWLTQQVRALAAEIGGDEIWIEKLELQLTGKRDLEAAMAEDSTLGALIGAIRDLPEDPRLCRG